MDMKTLQVLVQIGETTLPIVEAAVGDIVEFAKSRGASEETLAQLQAQLDENAATIASDEKTLDAGVDGSDTPAPAAEQPAAPVDEPSGEPPATT